MNTAFPGFVKSIATRSYFDGCETGDVASHTVARLLSINCFGPACAAPATVIIKAKIDVIMRAIVLEFAAITQQTPRGECMRRIKTAVLCFFCLLCSVLLSARAQRTTKVTLYEGARLILGDGKM